MRKRNWSAQAVPAGVLGPGQADEQQLVRVLDRLVGVVALGVGADEPAHLGVGLGQVAASRRSWARTQRARKWSGFSLMAASASFDASSHSPVW